MRYNSINCKEIDGIEQIVYESTLASDATSLTISGLDGDTDESYRLIIRGICPSAEAAHWVSYYFNADNTVSNYKQSYYCMTTSAGGSSDGTTTGLPMLTYLNGGDVVGFTDMRIYAKSGKMRSSIGRMSYNIKNDTPYVFDMHNQWTNTATNITSLTITGAMKAGTYICLMKRTQSTATQKFNELKTTGLYANAFRTIYEANLDTTNAFTLNGLDGNTDVLYSIELYQVGQVTGDSMAQIRLNDDSGNNYRMTYLYGLNTTFAGYNNAAQNTLYLTKWGTGGGAYRTSDSLLFAKSGAYRVLQTMCAIQTDAGLYAHRQSSWWNNSADNITSITFYGQYLSSSTIRVKALKHVI